MWIYLGWEYNEVFVASCLLLSYTRTSRDIFYRRFKQSVVSNKILRTYPIVCSLPRKKNMAPCLDPRNYSFIQETFPLLTLKGLEQELATSRHLPETACHRVAALSLSDRRVHGKLRVTRPSVSGGRWSISNIVENNTATNDVRPLRIVRRPRK